MKFKDIFNNIINEETGDLAVVEKELKKLGIKYKSNNNLITIITDEEQPMPERGDYYEIDFKDIKSLGRCKSSISDHPEYRDETENGYEVTFSFKNDKCFIYIS